MRMFLSTRLSGSTRGGISFNPNEFAPRPRGRPLAGASIGRPARSFYGVSIDQPDPSADE
jgi:hypothetical protein